MLHLSSEQTGINGFQFMHTSYQRKNFIYYLVDQPCKVLIAFPECPMEVVSEGDKWLDVLSEKGRLLSSSQEMHSATCRIWGKLQLAAGLGPSQTWVCACAQQGVKLWYPQALTDRTPVLKAQVMLLH